MKEGNPTMSETNGNSGGRDPMSGQFLTGHKFSGGGSRVSLRIHELRQSLLEAVSPGDVRAVGAKLLELAKAGDVQAAKVWLEFLIGKPTTPVEVSTSDGTTLTLPTIIAVVLAALGDDQAAKIRAAAAFRKLGSTSGNGP
jgi:hypothetical protein